MRLIIGGAYQGKLSYVKKQYQVKETDICFCEGKKGEIEEGKKVIYGLEHFILWQVENGIDSLQYVKNHRELFSHKTIICEDNACGIVPMDQTMRAYREASGRTLSYLAGEADEVVRVFCGIGSKLK